MQPSQLLILGDAPCLDADLAAFGEVCAAVMAINRAGVRHMGRIDFWCSYHQELFAVERLAELREARGGNTDYETVFGRDVRDISLSGSSTLLGVIWGLQRYGEIILAGAPLEAPDHHKYRVGWENEAKYLKGRVRSLSGWTKSFLEAL